MNISNTTPLLDQIADPAALRALPRGDLRQLADELRQETIDVVSVTGGHLGAGLGVVELTVALHYVFNTPEDKLIWDVGHQAYPHKILTGRRDRMRTLRQGGGLSGFTKRAESEYDPFGAAHSSTSISAGLGFAVAGWSRTPKTIPGVESFSGEAGLISLLSRSEILVCLLPLTAATKGILNAKSLAALPRGAFLINAARGGHVVEDDLLAALESGQIGHATLDVMQEEPLPPTHRFWQHPQVTVTPHVASLTWPPTAAVHIVANIRRCEAGLPMSPVVDPAREY